MVESPVPLYRQCSGLHGDASSVQGFRGWSSFLRLMNTPSCIVAVVLIAHFSCESILSKDMHTAPFDPMKVWDVVSCIVQDLAHFFSGQLLFQSIASQVSNLRGLLFSIGKEKIDNLRTPLFPLQRCAKCCFSNTVWEKENGRPSCCHLAVSARKKTRDNHDFDPQSSCLMPQASCTANRTFTLLNNI